MFPPFPEEKAATILEKVLSALKNGQLSLVQVARPSEERKNQGVMLGALVCKDKEGNEVALVTNSGNAKRLEISSEQLAISNNETSFTLHPRPDLSGNFFLVPPIVSPEEIDQALAQNNAEIHEITERIKNLKKNSVNSKNPNLTANCSPLAATLKKLCRESLEKVHALYNFHCIDGKIRSLKEICDLYNQGKLPPTGTGDCCAPKLFDYAFSHELFPLFLAETPYNFQLSTFNFQFDLARSVSVCSPEVAEGACDCSNERERRAEHATRDSGERPNFQFSTFNFQFNLTPPCDERCGILLPAMLGLRILYRDEAICVVNKQSGLLSVPGRGEDKQDCVESRFRRLFGDAVEILQPAVHRLDMETSGIMILAFTKKAHRELNRQFEAKEVHKEYVALLDGVLPKKGIAKHGQMELFFRLDVDNRPHQIWDAENGKSAVTEWEILGVERYHAPDGTTRNATRVKFMPHTGRTHQLRLASADSHGFETPIIGDTLYGKCEPGERLMLHAQKIEFTHPRTKERMTIECAPEF